MKKQVSLITFYLLLFTFLLMVAPRTHAQPTAVLGNSATPNFPQNITFELTLAEGHAVRNVALLYEVQKFSCIDAPARVPVALDGNRASWTWVLSRSGNLPPGAQVNWAWQLTAVDGSQTTTDWQTVTFSDTRFNWRTVSANGLHLSWYAGNDVGPLLLDAAVEATQRLENEMGIALQDDVQIFIYGDYDVMREAILFVQDWAGGVAFPEYNTILMGVPPNQASTWGVEVVPHELAHLIVGQYGRSCIGGSRPTWLNEGLAVYAEGPPSTGTLADIADGVQNNSFAPLRSLNGAFAADHSQAGIAYSQSYSVVAYLLESYGQAQMQALLRTLAEGDDYDAALTAVYGRNVDQIETEWRAAIGAPPRPIPPTATPFSAAAVATYAPSGFPETVPTPPAAAEPATQDGPRPQICGFIILLPLMMVGWNGRKRGWHS